MTTACSRVSSDGYAIIPQVFDEAEIERLKGLLPELADASGTRTLLDHKWACELADSLAVRSLVIDVLGPEARATRAILFDKRPNANWILGWHQDQKIVVPHRFEAEGYECWSEKEGLVHCRPPLDVMERSLAVRIHLDDCGPDNGPLRVLPGTHLDGYRDGPTPGELEREVTCTCQAGDVILMKPLLFHASSKSQVASHRRVIHIEYCAATIPPPA